jgi:hypothetical protein
MGAPEITHFLTAGFEVTLDGIGLLFKDIGGNHQGSSIPDVFIRLLVDLWSRGEFPFDQLLTRTYALREINQAITDMEHGEVVKPLFDTNRSGGAQHRARAARWLAFAPRGRSARLYGARRRPCPCLISTGSKLSARPQ